MVLQACLGTNQCPAWLSATGGFGLSPQGLIMRGVGLGTWPSPTGPIGSHRIISNNSSTNFDLFFFYVSSLIFNPHFHSINCLLCVCWFINRIGRCTTWVMGCIDVWQVWHPSCLISAQGGFVPTKAWPRHTGFRVLPGSKPRGSGLGMRFCKTPEPRGLIHYKARFFFSVCAAWILYYMIFSAFLKYEFVFFFVWESWEQKKNE
jgi:hypothetical protein